MANQLSYDARQVSSQGTQKILRRANIAIYEVVKAAADFIGHMVKIFLAK